MAKQLVWNPSAIADVRSIDRETAMRILLSITRFVQTGEGDVKRLSGIDPPEHRLRAGDYRVRFYDLPTSLYINSVRHRREAYR